MLARRAGLAASLTGEAQSLQPGDLALALDAGRVTVGQVSDQPGDAFAQLQREMGRGGTHQAPHVLDGHLAGALLAQRSRILGLAQLGLIAGWSFGGGDGLFCG